MALPGEMSLLAVSVQFYGKPELCLRLRRGPSTRRPRWSRPSFGSGPTRNRPLRWQMLGSSFASLEPALPSAGSSFGTHCPRISRWIRKLLGGAGTVRTLIQRAALRPSRSRSGGWAMPASRPFWSG